MIYKIQHKDTPNVPCIDFHPIRCQHRDDRKVLRLQNYGHSSTLDPFINEVLTLSIQFPTDCLLMRKTSIQFRRLCSSLSSPATPDNNSDPTYSSISSSGMDEEDREEVHPPKVEIQPQEKAAAVDDDNIFDANTNADLQRLCKAKLALDSVLGKKDTSLPNKIFPATEAPRLNTNRLLLK